MKIVQINTSVNYGSTGRIMEYIGRTFIQNGHESYIAYGRINGKSDSTLIKIGDQKDVLYHAIETYLFDKHGLASKKATKDFINRLDEIQPDVIGLHNIHGYYLNYQILFEYIKSKQIPVLWTFHDCWPFTGHCSYFDSVDCKKWQTHCHKCPLTSSYPKSRTDRSYKNFENKRIAFQGVEKLKIITPSLWLSNLVKKSFLQDYPVELIYNGVDIDVFKPLQNAYDLSEKIILGVASKWDARKGLEDFKKLRKLLPLKTKIVLIGLSQKQIDNLPKGILGLPRTESIEKIVEWYNRATVFVNPTYVDNFPTTNIEAMACGTPVITYDTGGSKEAVYVNTGDVVKKGDINELYKSITNIIKDTNMINACRKTAVTNFNSTDKYDNYLSFFEQFYIKS